MSPLLLGLALAAEPHWRWITHDQGLVSEHIDDLAVDARGVVWIATHAGLYRWEGQRATRVDGGAIDHEIMRLVVAQDGAIVAREALGRGWWLHQGEVRPLLGPDGRDAEVRDLELDTSGHPVALTDRGLQPVRAGALDPPLPLALPEGWRLVRRGPQGGWIIGTWTGFWLLPAQGEAIALGDCAISIDAELAPDGSIWTLDVESRVRRVSPTGEVLAEVKLEGRGHALALRGEEAWVSTGVSLNILQPDGALRAWGPREGVFTGGPLLVDAEGSVWLGTFRGLAQLPEPGAALWTRRDGLPGEASLAVEQGLDRLWISTWYGLAWIDPQRWEAGVLDGPLIKNPACMDGEGALWTVGTEGVEGPGRFVRLSETLQRWPAPAATHFRDACARAADGSVWITADDGLYRASGPRAPTKVSPWPDARLVASTRRIAVEQDGVVWVGGAQAVCRYVAGEPWRCLELGGRAWVSDLLVTPSGALWVADIDLGVSRLDGDRLVPMGGAAELASRHVTGLEPSPRGGVWVLSHGVVSRVLERPDLPDGWEVVEELAPWLGHLVSGPIDLLELPDGALWIAHNGGVTSITASARVRPSAPPAVLIQELRVDGEVVPGEGPLPLPRPDAILGLRFAAASWRAPALLRYRLRVDRGDWGAPLEAGLVELRGLPPGEHAVEIGASLDGVRWSEPPARLSFTVPRPWYGRPEPWALLLALLGGLALLAERVQHRFRLRMAELRTRIALDLHDHLGAGLGAIGLLAELLGRRDLPLSAAEAAAERIAGTAAELGGSLRGIVWSLRPESLWTDELGRWLAERAATLLPELAQEGRLILEISRERASLDLEVLRAVQLIGLEALHNAARHARADRVHLRLAPEPGGWVLEVSDDGVGLPEAPEGSAEGGNGLPGMRARAAEVGAQLQIGPAGARGTRVQLRFRPARPRPWWSLRR